jgi:hypothetical protein
MRLPAAHDEQPDGGSIGGGNSSAIDPTHAQEEALPLKRFLPVPLRLLNPVISACPFDMPRLLDQLELHFPHAVSPMLFSASLTSERCCVQRKQPCDKRCGPPLSRRSPPFCFSPFQQ